MKKIYAVADGQELRSAALDAIAEAKSDLARRRAAAQAYASGIPLRAEPGRPLGLDTARLAKIQTRSVWADRLSLCALSLWRFGLCSLALLALWWAAGGDTPLDQSPHSLILALIALAVLGLTLVVYHDLSAWAHESLGLPPGTLDASPEELNALIARAAPALALLERHADPLAQPSFGMIPACLPRSLAGEALVGAPLSSLRSASVYEPREWAPVIEGLVDGDIVCRFELHGRSASMAVGQRALARIATDLHFAIERAAELGHDPDPIATLLAKKTHERLRSSEPLGSLIRGVFSRSEA